MSARKSIVFAFRRRGKRFQSVQFAVCRKPAPAPREYFVPVRLVAYIPYNAVVGGMVHIMQRDSQFHHSETGGKMSGIVRQFVDDVVAQLFADLRQLFNGKKAQVGRYIDLR